MTACSRCGGHVAAGQEYCLDCGLRLLEAGPAGSGRDSRRDWVLRSVLALAIAFGGAAAAVATTSGSGDGVAVITATGGFATVPKVGTLPGPAEGSPGKTIEWPAGEDGWTIALASLPQTGGRRLAVARARKARARGLTAVGILDSSRYASLHPGYWIVFSGIYTSEAEATSALQSARRYARTATVRRIVP